MSEFELNLLRQRSLEAIRQKATRGELQFRLPVGFRWTRYGKVEIDADGRVQNAINLVFRKTGDPGQVFFRLGTTIIPDRSNVLKSQARG